MVRSISILATAALIFSSPNQALAELTKQQFVDYVVSMSVFLEQCSAQKIVPTDDVQNDVLRMAKELGLFDQDYWTPMQQGADGVVYDLLREKWIRMEFGQEACNLALGEQKKVQQTFLRYY